MRPQKGEARAAILAAADRLFYREGIRAVGVDTVADEAGITKRTLYYHFPNKEALVAAYLTAQDAKNRPAVTEHAESFGPLPGDRILGVFDAFIAAFDSPDFRGCSFLNAIVETDNSAQSVRDCVVEHKVTVRAWFASQLTQGGASDPDSLAEQMMLLLDGALIRVLVHPGSEVIRQAQKAARGLLGLAGVKVSAAVDAQA
jgi:AcrR family transcriptional regulator